MSQETKSAVAELIPASASEEAATADRIAVHVRGILEELGLDLDDPNLRGADLRVYARSFLSSDGGFLRDCSTYDECRDDTLVFWGVVTFSLGTKNNT